MGAVCSCAPGRAAAEGRIAESIGSRLNQPLTTPVYDFSWVGLVEVVSVSAHEARSAICRLSRRG